MVGEIKVCNNKTRFYQGKLSHFEKHLGDYINVILSLQQKPFKEYEKYISIIKGSVTSLGRMIPKLSKWKCQGQAQGQGQAHPLQGDDLQHLHFHYGHGRVRDQEDKSVNIEKIKSIINSTG